jgi:hypothetical protein
MNRFAMVVGLALLASANFGATDAHAAAPAGGGITIRTENFPRPPYSGATYYIYERDGKAICTKLEVCNKYDQCTTTYKQGSFKDDEDVQTGDPYGTTPAVLISAEKLPKHVCLTRFKLLGPAR